MRNFTNEAKSKNIDISAYLRDLENKMIDDERDMNLYSHQESQEENYRVRNDSFA